MERVGLWLLLAAGAAVMLFPVYWMFATAIRPANEIFSGETSLAPTGWVWGNFRAALDAMPFLSWAWNSTVIAVVAVVITVSLNLLCGYAFAKFRFAGRRVMLALLLGSVMVPLTALVIPTFVLFSNLNLTDSIWAVILPSLLNPFGVYLMQVYTADAVPDELLDAARVDGAGEIMTFLRVAFPLLRPAVVTVLLLSVVGTWNNYFLPLAMLANTKLFPITVGLGLWQGQASANNGGGTSLWGLIIVGSLVSVIPLVIAFLSLQKYWQGGLSLGALK
jgi:multiple sugar transport system permease protein